MKLPGIRPENEIFMILLIIFALLFSLRKPEPSLVSVPKPEPKQVDTTLCLNIQKNFSAKSAQISKELESELVEIAEMIDEKSTNHRFDGLEIIGHADTAPVGKSNYRSYNLDYAMAYYLANNTETEKRQIQSGSYLARNTASNTELAMIRAVVVTQFFREIKEQGELLQGIEFFVPMSAGAMVDTNYRLDTSPTGKSESGRRRIEFQLFSTRDRSSDEIKLVVE